MPWLQRPGSSLHQSLLGQHQRSPNSSLLVMSLLISTPRSSKFICRATLLLLGPLKQTEALSGSPVAVATSVVMKQQGGFTPAAIMKLLFQINKLRSFRDTQC